MFSWALPLGAELQRAEPDWFEIHKALVNLTANLDGLPWGRVTVAEINFFTRPCLRIFSQAYASHDGIPQKFRVAILERAAALLRRAVEARNDGLLPEQRHECFLVTLNMLKWGSLKALDRFPDELLEHSLQSLLLLLDRDHRKGLKGFGANMPIGLVFVLSEILDQPSRPYDLRVTALLLLERCFVELVVPETYKRVVPGILSLAVRVLHRNPDTDASKVLAQALALIKTALALTSSDLRARVQEAWAKDFNVGARAVVTKLEILTCHPSPRVQQKLLEVYFWALEAHQFEQDFKANLLVPLLPLVLDAHPEIRHMAFRTLNQIVDPPTLAACFKRHHAQLTQTFTAGVEPDKVRHMKLLTSVVLVLGPAVESQLDVAGCWMAWCKCLLPNSKEVAEVIETRVVLKEVAGIDRDPVTLCSEIQGLSRGIPLKYMRDPETVDAFLQFFKYLGLYCGSLDVLLFEATHIISADSMRLYHAAALRVMDCLISGRELIHQEVPLLHFHKEKFQPWFQPDEAARIRLALLPATVGAMDRFGHPSGFYENDELVEFQALHMVAVAAVAHGSNFRLELFSTLYTVIEKVGHPNPFVSWAARRCLKVLELACGYPTLMELIQDNLDYLLHSISLRLHPASIHPPTASMLSALFQLSGGQDLALLDDIFDLVADGLHAASVTGEPDPRTMSLFLEVVNNMVLPICRGLFARERQLLASTARQLTQFLCSTTLPGFISEYQRAKAENELLLLDEERPEADTPSDTNPVQPSEDKVVRRCHGRLKKIVSAATCFVSHSNPRCRQLAMQVITNVAQNSGDLALHPELVLEIRQPLNPLWHLVWPGLKSQLNSSIPYLCETALLAISSLQAFSSDFLSPRVAAQVIPKALELVKTPSTAPSLRLAGLKFLISGVRHLSAHAFDPWDLFDTVAEMLQLNLVGPIRVSELVRRELIPALQRQGGDRADVAYMLSANLLAPNSSVQPICP
ncbi:hypothetical protein L0F63_005197 [Massospora cicadina]|nr:hypothetical protein L0F63_005197 [Massospora cicadina]